MQKEDDQAQKIRGGKLGKKWLGGLQRGARSSYLPYVLQIIKTEFIRGHHDDPLAEHFGIEKTRELL